MMSTEQKYVWFEKTKDHNIDSLIITFGSLTRTCIYTIIVCKQGKFSWKDLLPESFPWGLGLQWWDGGDRLGQNLWNNKVGPKLKMPECQAVWH